MPMTPPDIRSHPASRRLGSGTIAFARTACALTLLSVSFVVGRSATGTVGLTLIGHLPSPLRHPLFWVWWKLRPRVASSVKSRVTIVDYTDPADAASAPLQEARRTLLREEPGLIWVHNALPSDPRCNPNAMSGAATRGCEIAAARRYAASRHHLEEFDKWLQTAEWKHEPESLRFELAALTGEDHFLEELPDLVMGVRRGVERAAQHGVSAAPLFIINGCLLPTSRLDLVLEAIAIEARQITKGRAHLNSKE